MRKIYTLIALLTVCSASFAQRLVTFKVVDSNYLSPDDKLTNVKFKGTMSSWADFTAYDDGTNGDATANDGVWTANYLVNNGNDIEWGATAGPNGSWIIVGPNQKFNMTNGVISGVVGDTVWRVKRVGVKKVITYVVVDSNYQNNTFKFTDVKFKGAMTGWNDQQMYDDGTNGDAVANDGKWTLKYKTNEGTYEWGATDKGNWIIVGPNKKVTLNPNMTVSGDSVYRVAKVGSLINVTVRVDMSDTIVNSDGIFVTGNFLSFLESPISNWNKDTLKLTQVGTSKVYEKTVRLYAGNYQWKFYNGKGNANDARGENWITAACGEKDGFGNFNRSMALKGRTTDIVFPTYKWNRCETIASTRKLKAENVSIYPNPTSGNVTIKADARIATVKVTTLDGKIVSNTTVNAMNTSLNTSGLRGIYMVEVTQTNGAVAVQKLVVK